jgi:hypothetical protein
VPARLGETLDNLLENLSRPEPDWRAVETAWLEGSLQAAGTPYEQPLRNTGVALITRDAKQLRAWLQPILENWRDDPARVC